MKVARLVSRTMSRGLLVLFVFLLFSGLGWAGASSGPSSGEQGLAKMVPTRVQLSVASGQIFLAIQLHVTPQALGADSWLEWDRDGNGSLDAQETRSLVSAVAAASLRSHRVALGGQLIDWRDLSLEHTTRGADSLGLREPILVRASGTNGHLSAGEEAPFVVYAPPQEEDGIVPVRLSVGAGLLFRDVAGARAEQRGPRRIEAVLSRRSPALWGTVVGPMKAVDKRQSP
jgi:hypothetical protein